MSGLHVPLDVEYAADDKIMDAGPMAELLFIRGLAFCKRTMSDGKITDRQLASVALGISNAKKHAQRLVEVGLWSRGRDHWAVINWLKYNAPASDIEAAQKMAKENGVRGNHDRWHCNDIGEVIKPSPKCAICRATYRPPDRPPDGVADPLPDRVTASPPIAKEEPEPEEEPQTEPLTLKEPIASSVRQNVTTRSAHIALVGEQFQSGEAS